MELPTIEAAVQAIAAGRLTPVELVEGCLTRIARLEDRIHAWVLVDEAGTRREAQRLTDVASSGELLGPLHGIPVGIKDIIDVEGLPTKAGSPLREDHLAPRDAAIVANLRSAGAIILGKTVTTPWACFDPPPTRNPWNLAHTPGGSSSGSAAAVATEMCMAALGTQTGGSIIRPAAYCGIAGYKPRHDPQALDGTVQVSFHLDHIGFLARSAEDLCYLQGTVDLPYAAEARNAGINFSDPGNCSFLSEERLRFLGGLPERAPRLYLLEQYFREEADADVRRVLDESTDVLRAAGAIIETVSLPPCFAEVHAMHRRIMAVEAAAYHRRCYEANADAYPPTVAALISEGLATSVGDYADALEHRLLFQRELDKFTWQKGQRQSRWGVDALLTPATPAAAPSSLDTTGDPRFNSPWSYAGLPAVTFPAGFSDSDMPIGLQLAGPAWGTDSRLELVAAWCEQQIGFDRRPALLA